MLDAEILAHAAIAYPILLFSLTFHEWGHAMSAKLLGDRTAELQGRLTMNPISHIDPIGTVLFPLIAMLQPGLARFIIGWAKPIPVNPLNLRKSTDMVWVALAGPACNLILVLLGVLVFKVLLVFDLLPAGERNAEMAVTAFLTFIGINLILIWFNLIPLPPLDGSKVLLAHVKGHWRSFPFWQAYEAYGQFVLLILFLSGGLSLILRHPMIWSYDVILRFLF